MGTKRLDARISTAMKIDYEHGMNFYKIGKKYGVSFDTARCHCLDLSRDQLYGPRRKNASPNPVQEPESKPVQEEPEKPVETPMNSCWKCQKTFPVPDAIMCPYCGADVRSERVKLVERLKKFIRLVDFMPNNSRDEFVQTTNDTIRYLEKEGKC